MDMFRINEHDILQCVEYENFEDEVFEDVCSSHHASSSVSAQVPADSTSQQQRQQQPQATSPSVPDPFAAPRPSASAEQAAPHDPFASPRPQTTYGDDVDDDEQATTQRQGSRISSARRRGGPVFMGAARRPSKVLILESETLGVPTREMSGPASPLGEGRPTGSPSPQVAEGTGGRVGRGHSPCQQGGDLRSAMPGASSHKAGSSGFYSNGMLLPGPTQSDGEAGGMLANFNYGRPRIFKTPMPTLHRAPGTSRSSSGTTTQRRRRILGTRPTSTHGRVEGKSFRHHLRVCSRVVPEH